MRDYLWCKNNPKAYLVKHLPVIDAAIKVACRRHEILDDQAEEFASHTKLKLIENDYHLIRSFQGKSSFRTYLFTVINRIFIDWLRMMKGRWRPSEYAKRLGQMGIKLEELMARKKLSYQEACYAIKINHGVNIDSREFRKLADKISKQLSTNPRQVDIPLEKINNSESTLKDPVIDKNSQEIREKIVSIIKDVSESLEANDKLILKMHFHDNLGISVISRILKQKRHGVDARLKFILVGFKEKILANGININDARDAINSMYE